MSNEDSIPEYTNSYIDYLLIVSRVMSDRCMYTLFHHFDVFATVERIYPEQNGYSWLSLLKEPSHIVDNIYLGSAFNAADFKMLKHLDIKVIINATKSIRNFNPSEFIYYNYPTEDIEDGSLRDYYETCYQSIVANSDKNVLVHCFAGRSRSAALVLYYIMKKYDVSLSDALDLLCEQRPLVNINQTFIKEVEEELMRL
jgi:hypothetical protein